MSQKESPFPVRPSVRSTPKTSLSHTRTHARTHALSLSLPLSLFLSLLRSGGGIYEGATYGCRSIPRGIPLLVTSAGRDNLGFKIELALNLRDLYLERGEGYLFGHYHNKDDGHMPRSFKAVLPDAVRAVVALGTSAPSHGAVALAHDGSLRSKRRAEEDATNASLDLRETQQLAQTIVAVRRGNGNFAIAGVLMTER